MTRRLVADDALSALAFVEAATAMSVEHGHFPEVYISERHVTLTLSTNFYGRRGLSERDFLVAQCYDQIPVTSVFSI